MARGRKRNPNLSVPAHIDPIKLPKGIYWDKSGAGRWYVRENGKTPRVAGPKATLSELHEIMERRANGETRGTLAFAITAFEASTAFAALAPATQRDYKVHGKLVRHWQLRVGELGQQQIDRMAPSLIHALIEAIAKGRPESRPGADDAIEPRPSTANHVLRLLRRLFAWGIVAGCCTTNPAAAVKQVKERGRNTMPPLEVFTALLTFARSRGARKRRTEGACPPYLAPIMEIAYLCRMRGIEAVRLTDTHATTEGVVVNRVKGSNDNLVRWTPRLRAAWDEAVRVRTDTRGLKRNLNRPIPMRPQDRFLFLGESAQPLTKGALDQAMQDLKKLASAAGVLPEDQLFSLHGLKHRGMTDTAGDKGQKRTAGGHKSEAMVDRYDHELPVVNPAGTAEFSGEFSGGKKKGTPNNP